MQAQARGSTAQQRAWTRARERGPAAASARERGAGRPAHDGGAGHGRELAQQRGRGAAGPGG